MIWRGILRLALDFEDTCGRSCRGRPGAIADIFKKKFTRHTRNKSPANFEASGIAGILTACGHELIGLAGKMPDMQINNSPFI